VNFLKFQILTDPFHGVGGAASDDPLEYPGKVIVVVKSNAQSSLGDGGTGFHEVDGLITAQPVYIAHNGAAGVLPKQAAEVAFGQADLCGDVVQGDGVGVVMGDVVQDLSGISQGIVILEDGAGSVSQMAMAPKEETE